MNKVLIPLMLCFFISSCASCHEREIYKPRVASKNKLNISIESYNYTKVALIEFGEVATLRISECTVNEQICIIARLDELHTLEIPNAKIGIYSDTTARLDLPMGNWEFRQESIEPIKPTTAVIEPKVGEPNFDTFSASALFNGAPSEWAPPTQRLLSKELGWLEFRSPTTLPNNLGNQFYLKLPKVIFDGKEYDLPTLEFNRISEEFCYYHA